MSKAQSGRSSRSSPWVLLLFLSYLPASSLDDSASCTNPVGQHFPPFCCIEQKVDINTVRTTFEIEAIGDDEWKLGVNISWGRPNGKDFDAYAVGLDYTDAWSPSPFCEGQFPKYDIRDEQWIHLYNETFGAMPYLTIYTANRAANLTSPFANDYLRFEWPDCYESTRSISFCQTQEVRIAGRPIRLQVESVVAEEPRDSSAVSTANVTVSWSPPVQINSQVVLIGFYVGLLRNGGVEVNEIVPVSESQRSYSNPLSLTFAFSFEGVKLIETDDLQIQVLARVDDKRPSCPPACYFHGSTATLQINLGPENATQLPPNFTTGAGSVTIGIYVAIPAVAVVALLVLVLVLLISCRRRLCLFRPSNKLLTEFKRNHLESNYGPWSNYHEGQIVKKTPKVCFAKKEFDPSLLSEISKISEIGRGSFGVVYKGFAYGSINGKLGYYPVAVKGLKDNATSEMKSSFLDEISLMIEMGSHPNIIPVLGCCTVDEPYLLVTEFMKYGDLRHFLLSSRESKMAEEDATYHLTEVNQLQIARQVARAMEYISKTRYYHGDLAARNVLVGEHLIVKVSDFGLADDIYERGYKRLSKSETRPVKWVSLEANTTGKYSIEGDIWSFGILLYEIYTRGGVPYPGLGNLEVIEKLKQGYRMDRPDDCPAEIYDIMRKCWQERPSARPSFTQLCESLDKLLERHADYLSLDESAGNSTANSADLSGKSDDLQLWLHVNGDLPEGARTLDFVPIRQGTANSNVSDVSKHRSVDDANVVYTRDLDGDVITA